jgi:hypothetical protein
MGFPNYIVSVPDVRIIGMDDELLLETKKVMKASSSKTLFQYDTTFTLTGLYCSVLSYIHPMIAKANTTISPIVPLAYFYNEKKYEGVHDEFFR